MKCAVRYLGYVIAPARTVLAAQKCLLTLTISLTRVRLIRHFNLFSSACSCHIGPRLRLRKGDGGGGGALDSFSSGNSVRLQTMGAS